MPKQCHGYEQEPHLHFFVSGTRSTIRKSWDFRNTDINIENIEGAIYWGFFKRIFTVFTTHFKIIVNRSF